MPQEKESYKIRTLLPYMIIFIVTIVFALATIVLLCVLIDDYDDGWFWVLMATFGSFILFFAVFTAFCSTSYAIINAEALEFGSWKGKCYCDMKNIDYIESFKQYRVEAVILHFIEPLQVYKRGEPVQGKTITKYGFIESSKIVKILKKFVPKEIEWIFTDYNKYPNTGRK